MHIVRVRSMLLCMDLWRLCKSKSTFHLNVICLIYIRRYMFIVWHCKYGSSLTWFVIFYVLTRTVFWILSSSKFRLCVCVWWMLAPNISWLGIRKTLASRCFHRLNRSTWSANISNNRKFQLAWCREISTIKQNILKMGFSGGFKLLQTSVIV